MADLIKEIAKFLEIEEENSSVPLTPTEEEYKTRVLRGRKPEDRDRIREKLQYNERFKPVDTSYRWREDWRKDK